MYYLMVKDVPVLKFSLKIDDYGGEPAIVEKILDNKKLPFGFTGILNFIRTRKPPSNRENYKSILNSIGPQNEKRIVDLTNCLSLNDCYWIKDFNDLRKWEEVSLYKNKFSDILILNAFNGDSKKIFEKVTSPEFTTNGALRKCWRNINGKPVLYKSGTEGFSNSGKEPYTEFYISNSDYIKNYSQKYDLEVFNGKLCSTCECFCDEDTSYVPIYELLDKDLFKKTSVEILKESRKIYGEFNFDLQMVIDYIFVNTDRHYANFGMLYNPETKEIISSAPIFDNGMALWQSLLDEDFENQEYMKEWMSYATHYSRINFNKILEIFINSNFKNIAEEIRGYKLPVHEKYNFSEYRREVIEKLVNNRIESILDFNMNNKLIWR